MNKFKNSIDKQIEFNKGKNILYDKTEFTFKFINDTINAIADLKEINADSENLLIDYATDKVLEEFCRINQYYTFNSESKKDLRKIYVDLFSNLRDRNTSNEMIAENHFQKLKQWLLKTNHFAESIYTNDHKIIEAVACSEYSPELQIEILHIDISQLMKPVLDIGCGKQGNLVNYLCKKGIEAYGFDRFNFDINALTNSDWLKYNYGIKKWGTIISNLGFSNHFMHHNLREDGNYIEYGKTYMDILNALMIGGCFHYAPDLPFIEQYLDNNTFELTKFKIGEFDFKTTIIKRLR